MYVRWLLELYGIEFQSKKKGGTLPSDRTPAARLLIENHFRDSNERLRHSNFSEKAAQANARLKMNITDEDQKKIQAEAREKELIKAYLIKRLGNFIDESGKIHDIKRASTTTLQTYRTGNLTRSVERPIE